ncbi:hypothetical protein H1235_01255 [Pseudoxanthomonas sp. NC8]|nr:hypothetical protein H1235_01255 [Pseudoxanthomonas sp. NC8]
MIIWGSGGDIVPLGAAGTQHCATCESAREFRDVLNYRYAHVWYLFAWVTEKAYVTACSVCGRGVRHDSKAFEAKLGRTPIPAYRRFGGLVLLGLVATVVLAGMLAGMRSNVREDALLQDPRVGDVYTVDLQEMAPGSFDGHAYGLMRVVAVDTGTVSLEVPNVGYNKLSGASGDLDKQAREADYYSGEVLSYPRPDL